MEQWNRIASAKGSFAIEYADWFFLPNGMWDSPVFWATLWKSRSRVTWWVIDVHDGLLVPWNSDSLRYSVSDFVASVGARPQEYCLYFKR